MTGYARAEGSDQALAWTWEAKSVNGRGLEIRCRLPAGYDALEIPAREAIQRRFRRGSIGLGLAIRRLNGAGAAAIDENRLAQLAQIAAAWQRRLPDLRAASIDGLLALRGVLDAGEAEAGEGGIEARSAPLLASLDRALDELAAMRAAEGERTGKALALRLDEIAALVGQAEALAVADPARGRERLRERVQALLDAVPALPEDRLMQEAALIAAKGDVTEEIERLRAHVAAARELLADAEPVGRRLDFLCQEFNREANTLCAKAAELALTAVGLKLKAAIEQLREQVQNVE